MSVLLLSRLVLRLHDKRNVGTSRIDLRQEPVYVPLERTQNGEIEIILLQDFLNFDVIALSFMAERPGLLGRSCKKYRALAVRAR